MPRKPTTQPSLVTLPTLSEIIVSLGSARESIETATRAYDLSTMADRIWIGVLCLAGQEHHSLSASAKGSLGGRGKKACHAVTSFSEMSPDQAHPQGFEAWLKHSCPWLQRPTAYKYMDAAKGAGLLAHTPESEVRSIVAGLIERHQQLSLAGLIAQGKNPPPPDKEAKKLSGNQYQQMTFDSLLNFRAQSDQLVACRDHMSDQQYKIACARAYDTLKRLTGQPWQPADEDVPEYISVLSAVNEGGL